MRGHDEIANCILLLSPRIVDKRNDFVNHAGELSSILIFTVLRIDDSFIESSDAGNIDPSRALWKICVVCGAKVMTCTRASVRTTMISSGT
jgi:hypothetical protein